MAQGRAPDMDWCSIATGIVTGALIALIGSIVRLRHQVETLRDEIQAMRRDHTRPLHVEWPGP